MKDNCLLVSVESRKGGVGKTTAALNLARILLEKKGYAVLLLDVDITGTNAMDALDSSFWRNICHTVDYTITGKESEHANLLEIFDRRFMTGFGIPKFNRIDNNKSRIVDNIFIFETNKINVIGSQIYEHDNTSSKESDGKNIICEPSILFDELHAFWFVEFLQEICANFIEKIREDNPDKYIAVIIDNSPGYVGTAPAIQEWLTDIGPEKGKFLTISSLDKQDLLVCGYAIHNLHRLFTDKWNASRKFMQAIHSGDTSKKEINLTPNEEGFFLRLVESKHLKTLSSSLKECIVDVADTGLSFYQNDNINKGDVYLREPEKYQGLIINRVPRFVKSERYSSEIEDMYSFLNRQTSRELSHLLGDSIRDLTVWMVSYDEYIEFQFIESMIYRGDEWMPPRMRHFGEELMHFIRERRIPPLYKEFQSMLQEEKMIHPEMLDEVRRSIQKLHESVSEIIRLLEQYGYRRLTRLIHEEWLPGNILRELRTAIQGILLETDFPFPEYEMWEMGKEPVSPMAVEFIKDIEHEAMRLSEKTELSISSEILRQFLPSLSVVLALSVTYLWLKPLRKEFAQLFGSFAYFEAKHWNQRKRFRKKKPSLQEFLANDKMTDKEYKEFRMKPMFHPRWERWEKGQSMRHLYYQCSSAQARILDIQQDSEFLINVIQRLVKDESRKSLVPPNIKGIIEKVIVNKTVSHEAGRRQISKGFSSAEYMEEFSDVLEKILERWEKPV